MREKKMLAVRLPSELVDAVKDYATTEQVKISLVVENFIRLGLKRNVKQTEEKRKEIDASTRKLQYQQFRQARKRGEVYRWADKKMLAVRLPSELVDAVKDYAVKEEKNVVEILEEFFRFGLEKKQGKVAVSQIPTSGFKTPFKHRQRTVKG